MKTATIKVVDQKGYPLKDVYFQMGFKKFVSSKNGEVTLEYQNETDIVDISLIGIVSMRVDMAYLLNLENSTLVIGGKEKSYTADQKSTQEKPGRLKKTVTVKDEKGNLLANVHVSIPGSKWEGVTDQNGKITIEVEDRGVTLMFSYSNGNQSDLLTYQFRTMPSVVVLNVAIKVNTDVRKDNKELKVWPFFVIAAMLGLAYQNEHKNTKL